MRKKEWLFGEDTDLELLELFGVLIKSAWGMYFTSTNYYGVLLCFPRYPCR